MIILMVVQLTSLMRVYHAMLTADGGYMLENGRCGSPSIRSTQVEGILKHLILMGNDNLFNFALYATTNFFLTEDISGEFGLRYVT